MSRAPARPSSYYRALGWRPVYAYGLVLWLSPPQYEWVVQLDADHQYPDATDEQIARQDEWYEQAQAEADQEIAEFLRWFKPANIARLADPS